MGRKLPQPIALETPSQSPAPPSALDVETIDAVVRAALDEDTRVPGETGPGCDLTSDHALPEGARARGRLVAKASGCLAGLAVFARTFELCDPEARVELLASDAPVITLPAEASRASRMRQAPVHCWTKQRSHLSCAG